MIIINFCLLLWFILLIALEYNNVKYSKNQWMKKKQSVGILGVDFPHQSFSSMNYPKKDIRIKLQGTSSKSYPIKYKIQIVMKKIFDLLRKHEDKVIHLAINFLIVNMNYDYLILVIIAVILSILKELYDKYVKKTYIDKYDLLADAFGIILGSIFRLII